MTQERYNDSPQATELLKKQLRTWPLLRENHQALEKIQIKEIFVDDINFHVQFNPSRIVSSAAKTDPASIKKRDCFLCLKHLPAEQEYLTFGKEYLILCNPFPIFPEHFTIPTCTHVDQSILNRFGDMLELSQYLNAFTIFYNGPRSGASAPDHMHFQAVTQNYMPIDKLDASKLQLIYKGKDSALYLLTNYLRNGFVIQSEHKEEAESFFTHLCKGLIIPSGEIEPMMNVFCNYKNNKWIIKVIPRKAHRPSQYFAEGEAQILTSPGAADIGGVFITSRKEDFEKITPALLRDIYGQICFTNKDFASTRIF